MDTEPAALITVEVTANESDDAVPEPTLNVDAVPAPLAIVGPARWAGRWRQGRGAQDVAPPWA